jgi:hypothetical protein
VRSAERHGCLELASASGLTFHRDSAPVKPHDFLHERETDAGSFNGSTFLAIDLVEPLKKLRQMVSGDAGTRIGDGEFGGFAVGRRT